MTYLVSKETFTVSSVKMGESDELVLNKPKAELMSPYDYVLKSLESGSLRHKEDKITTFKPTEKPAEDNDIVTKFWKKVKGDTSSEVPLTPADTEKESDELFPIRFTEPKMKPEPYIFKAWKKKENGSRVPKEPENDNAEPAKTSSNWKRPTTNFEKDIGDAQKQANNAQRKAAEAEAQRKEAAEAQKNAPINDQQETHQVGAPTANTRKEIEQIKLEIATMIGKPAAPKNQVVVKPAALKSWWAQFVSWLFGWRK